MIGVDTNVLARLLVEDDSGQQEKAKAFFRQRTPDDPAFVGAIVIAEFVWLLTSRYRYSMDAVHTALEVIFSSANVAVEREELLKAAVAGARESGADIADALIAAIAIDAGAAYAITFDRVAAKRVAGMELLA